MIVGKAIDIVNAQCGLVTRITHTSARAPAQAETSLVWQAFAERPNGLTKCLALVRTTLFETDKRFDVNTRPCAATSKLLNRQARAHVDQIIP